MINIEEKYLYEIDINDTFFDLLRSDYKATNINVSNTGTKFELLIKGDKKK